MPATPSKPQTFSAYGETFTVSRRPPTLLLSELARTGSGDPEAVGVIAEFLEHVLGSDEYRRLKRASYAYTGDDEAEALGKALQSALEAAVGTPTK